MLKAVADFRTHLSINECQQRLRKTTSRNTLFLVPAGFTLLASKPILGRIKDNEFQLRRPSRNRKGSIVVIHGKLEETPGGTRVVAWASNYFPAMVGMLCFSYIFNDQVTIALRSASTSPQGISWTTDLLIISFFLMLMGLLLLWGAHIARLDRHYLLKHLATVLKSDAVPVSPPPLFEQLTQFDWSDQSQLITAAIGGGAILVLSNMAAHFVTSPFGTYILWLGDFTAPSLAGWFMAALYAQETPLPLSANIYNGLLQGILCTCITIILTLELLSAWPPLYLLAMVAMGGVGGYLGGRQFASQRAS